MAGTIDTLTVDHGASGAGTSLWRHLGLAVLALLFLILPESVALPRLREGDRALHRGDFETALANYAKAQSAQPWQLEPFLRAGEAHLRAGEAEEAAAVFAAAQALHPGAWVAWHGQGRALAAMGRYDAAAEAFGRAAELGAGPEAATKAGMLFVRAGDLDLARAWFERAAEDAAAEGMGVLETRARIPLALITALADPAAAETHARRLAQIAPHGTLMDARAVQAAVAEAGELAEPARAAVLGRAALGQGYPYLAEALLRRARTADPSLVDSKAYHALALLAVGQPEAAREAAVTALRLDEQNPLARYARAVALRAGGETRSAVADLRQLIASVPAEPAFVIELAAAYADLGAYDLAAEHVAKAVDLPGAGDSTYLTAAEFFLERAFDSAQAVAYGQRAAEALPGEARAWEAYGWALHLLGDDDAALPQLREAVALNADSASAHYRLGAVYEAMGQIDKAREEYGLAAGLDPTGADGRRARAALRSLLSRTE